jgi:arylsulfatase A-like enzyme
LRVKPDVSTRAQSRRQLTLLALATWFGLVTGLLELVVLLLWHHGADSTKLGALQMNRHFPWMIPGAHLAIFLALGLPLALVASFRPLRARRLATVGSCALASFALLSIIRGLHPGAAGALAVGLGYRLSRRIERRAGGFDRIVRLSIPGLLVVVALLEIWCFDRQVLAERRALSGLPPAARGAPNVLLVVLDTVRADRLSLYGYNRDTSPSLRRLAQRGVVFAEARATAPWTLPSHASLFTGHWPHELNVGPKRPLDTAYPTLAEFFARHGYSTAGFVGNTYFCNSWYGLARGFAHYEDYYEQNILISPGEALRCTALGRFLICLAGSAYNVRPDTANNLKDAERVNRDFLRWLDAHSGRPFFAFLNYIDAHDPYQTPPGFDRHFGLKPETPEDVGLIQHWHARNKANVTPREVALIRDGYDDRLAYLDEQLGRLFDELTERGTLDNTLVIVTADHGEQLGEHRLFGHGLSLYRHELQVPLIMVGPSGIPPGRSIAGPVTLRDVSATIVEWLGLRNGSPFPGQSLSRFWESPSQGPGVSENPILATVAVLPRAARKPRPDSAPALDGPVASVISGGKVYIRDAFNREELFDLVGDPDEIRNLAQSTSSRESLERCRIVLDNLMPAAAAHR